MKGKKLRKIRKDLGLTLQDLEARWGVGKSTIQREEEKHKVRGLYKDAIIRVQREHETDTDPD